MTISGHILIIDDEATLRQTMARILQQAGFEVTTAENGEQGLDFLKTSNFDMVYMDIRMPGLAGPDVLKLIHASYPSLPVVLVTAQPDLNSALDALRSGATDYMLKPIKPQMLIDRASTILANQQKEKRKREITSQIEALQTELKLLESNENVSPSILQPVVKEKDRFLKRGVLVLDMHTRRLIINEKTINVPPTSFDYLVVLARHTPNVVNYQTLVAEAQGYEADLREAQELTKWHIHQLRQAIEKNSQEPSYLINVRGTGYRLVAD
jgi:DNA-binding response OmpR family regulator